MLLASNPTVDLIAALIGDYLPMLVAKLFIAHGAAWHSPINMFNGDFRADVALVRFANRVRISGPPIGTRTAQQHGRRLPPATVELHSVAAGIGLRVRRAGSAVTHRALKASGELAY